MKIAEILLPEFDREMALTRGVLERVPSDKRDWKPHVKSRTLGQLANHVSSMPRWVMLTLTETGFDPASPAAKQSALPPFETTEALLEVFDRNVVTAHKLLSAVDDEALLVQWTLTLAGKTVLSLPRFATFRTWAMNHGIHHRGQLTVYLRELDVPLPSIYGPTADLPM